MRSLLRRAAVPALLLPLLAACSGGTGSSVGAPNPGPTATPTPGPLPVNAARNAAQGALLAGSAAGVFLPVAGGPRLLAVRRTSSRAPRATVPCSNGFDEQDTAAGQFTTHVVISLYYDPGCTKLRQRATFDFNFGVDTSDASGTVASYDSAGHVTATQAVTDFYFASGGFTKRQWTDTAGASTTPFGHTSAICLFSVSQCTLVAVTDGPGFETGVLLTATIPTTQTGPGSPVTIPFSGSVRLGEPGSIAIVDTQPLTAPSLTGGGSPVAISGTVSVTFATAGPAAFTLSMDVGSTHVNATLSDGTTTVTVADGTTATVNADGDGTIRYANGTTENIVDFRISG